MRVDLGGTWRPHPDDDTHRCGQRLTCRRHPDVAPFCSCIGVPVMHRGRLICTVYTSCPACWYETRRPPTRDEFGLEAAPDYWRTTHGMVSCDYHPARRFALDECCLPCVDEDEERAA